MLKIYSRECFLWVRTTVDLARSLQALGDLGTAEKMLRRWVVPPAPRSVICICVGAHGEGFLTRQHRHA
jgi:hypothetical protein